VQVGTAGTSTIFTDWTKIFAGNTATCGIRAGGSAWCWGGNSFGQLGDGGVTDNLVPTVVTDGGPWSYFSLLARTTIGIKSDGSLYGAGSPKTSSIYSPYDVTFQSDNNNDLTFASIPTALNFIKVESDDIGTKNCGITNDSALYCWGVARSIGLIGNSTYSFCAGYPQDLTGAWMDFTDVAAIGDDSQDTASCGLRQNGSIWCWGGNGYGFLGAGLSLSDNTFDPVQVTGGGTWRSFEGSEDNHVCGVKTDNTAWCWGRDLNGQLGNGATTTTDQTAPVPVDGGAVWSVLDANGNSSCGVRLDGTLWCWGSDASEQLGNGVTAGNQVSPTQVTDAGPWSQVAVGVTVTCGIKTDNTAWCWGSDASGQIGNGATAGTQNAPVAVVGGYQWQKLAAGGSTVCGITNANDLLCWGSDSHGQMGNGPGATAQDAPALVSGGRKWTDVALAGASICGISNGQVLCWGQGSTFCNNGDCECDNVDDPQLVGNFSEATRVDLAEMHFLVLERGRAWVVGAPYNYAYGSGFVSLNNVGKPSGLPCENPAMNSGTIIFNSTAKVLQYCDGQGWRKIGR
jgi:alpha-tubulin suppressor-like RCC1 family protein